MINVLNPNPYIFWFVLGGPLLMSAYMQNAMTAAVFLVSFYVCLVGAKMILAIAVHRSRNFLQGRIYVRVMKGLGVVLILFAMKLFWDGIQLIKG